MRVMRIAVRHFRGIQQLDWDTRGQSICCLIGPGDSSKTTVLDAIEATLSPRWITFTEADFHHADTAQEVSVEVTVGELPKVMLSDERFGLYLRGVAADGTLHDEPADDDQPVLTVKLVVDATMEPIWTLVCDRAQSPRILSNRDRALFGLVRLAGEEARHLTWAQGSVLARMTGADDGAAQRLAGAYRAARQSANLGAIPALSEVAGVAEREARALGAYVNAGYAPDLELGRGGFNAGAIALHDGAVPLRLAGLGTRRLATLAVQRTAVAEGAIVLVDELEQGLEPHRILAAMSQLRRGQEQAAAQGLPQGQVMMTTHSDVALSELNPASLFVVRRWAAGETDIRHATEAGDLARILKHSPRALFGRKILVCEGKTELGLMLGLRELFVGRHDGIPIEHRGAAIIDGGGAAAPPLACALAALGFPTALYRDSDQPVGGHWGAELQRLNVRVIQYGQGLNTETATFSAAPDDIVPALLNWISGHFDAHTIIAQLRPALGAVDVAQAFQQWPDLNARGADYRRAIAGVALQNHWFKDLTRARTLAPLVDMLAARAPVSPLAITLRNIEAWLYD